jgi:hypothetical protein
MRERIRNDRLTTLDNGRDNAKANVGANGHLVN